MIKSPIVLFILLCVCTASIAQHEERNKEIARNFYNDLWFNDHTDRYDMYISDEYRIHDIGDDGNTVEMAIVQKEVADFFWENGSMSGEIDYQIAEGDLVATRWYWDYKPSSILGSFMVGDIRIPIINVFRFNEQGKVIEIWNHRHDIDTNRTNIYLLKGLGIGLLLALIPLIWALRLRKKLKTATD
ncbi:MAG: ester cyclase [Cyclobacteriaceae bacterium]